MTNDKYRRVGGLRHGWLFPRGWEPPRGSASGPLRMIFVEGPKSGAAAQKLQDASFPKTGSPGLYNRIEVFGRDREEIARILLAAFEPNGADDPARSARPGDDWEGIACRLSVRLDEAIKERDEAIKERDEATEQLQQAKAQKLQAVKVLVGADECCGECQDASENENQRRAGGGK